MIIHCIILSQWVEPMMEPYAFVKPFRNEKVILNYSSTIGSKNIAADALSRLDIVDTPNPVKNNLNLLMNIMD